MIDLDKIDFEKIVSPLRIGAAPLFTSGLPGGYLKDKRLEEVPPAACCQQQWLVERYGLQLDCWLCIRGSAPFYCAQIVDINTNKVLKDYPDVMIMGGGCDSSKYGDILLSCYTVTVGEFCREIQRIEDENA